MKTGIKIVQNKLLWNRWFIVRGPHHTPIGGSYATKAEAVAALARKQEGRK